jgi:large-conductance mechanosensitive channel
LEIELSAHCHLKSTVLIGLAFSAYVNNVQMNIRKKLQQLLFCMSTARNMQRRSFVFARFGTNGLTLSQESVKYNDVLNSANYLSILLNLYIFVKLYNGVLI